MSMRLAVVAPSFELGGMETTLFRLVRQFASAGASVTVVTTVRPGPWFSRLADITVQAVSLPHPPMLSMVRHAERVGRYLAAGRFDAVLLNHSLAAQSTLAMLDDRVAAIPVIHNDQEWVYDVGCSNPNRWNAAVAVGGRVHDAARARLPGRPVHLIPNGVELPHVSPARRCVNDQRPLALAFIGRLAHRQKGIFLLPAIVARCLARGREVALTIAGDGPDRAELQRAIESAGVGGQVKLVGPLTPDESLALMGRSDMLLMPSFFEGLPIVLLEAMAQGCVPVASDLARTTADVVRDGVEGRLVRPGDADAFATAVVELARDPAALDAMRAAARQRIRARFSVETMAAAYLDLIGQALGGSLPLPTSRSSGSAIDLSLMRTRDRLPRLAGDMLDSARRLRRAVNLSAGVVEGRA